MTPGPFPDIWVGPGDEVRLYIALLLMVCRVLASLAITHASFPVQTQWYPITMSCFIYTARTGGEKGGLLAKYETDANIRGYPSRTSFYVFQTPPFIIIRSILAQVCFSLLAHCVQPYRVRIVPTNEIAEFSEFWPLSHSHRSCKNLEEYSMKARV